jgi:hypothetical protein
VKLLQNRIKQADFIRTVWSAQPEPGTTLDEMLLPEYWANVAKTLKKGDRIDVTSADGEWLAELLVRASADNSVTVSVLQKYVFSTPEAPVVDDAFDIKHRGGAKWSVLRKSDKRVMVENLETRNEAESWVAKNNLG